MMKSAGPLVARLWRSFHILLMAAAITAPARAVPPPPPVHRIVAIGDLHGDFAAWRRIAQAAGLVDDKGKWIGGDTVFVQTGDVVDRGPDSIGIINDLMRLQKEAPKAGGRVVALVGNHEAMNVTDDLRYVSRGDYMTFIDANSSRLRDRVYEANRAAIERAFRKKTPTLTSDEIRQAWYAAVPLGQIEHQKAWHPEGPIGQWVIGNPAVAEIDGNLFVHGGISAAYTGLSIEEINRRVAKALANKDSSTESILFADSGPLWYRGLAKGTVDDESPPVGAPPVAEQPVISTEDELQQVLRVFGAKRMVIGHTPELAGIQIVHNGRLVRIDTGISAFYGGTLSYLEIIDGKLVPHDMARAAPAVPPVPPAPPAPPAKAGGQ